MTDIVKAEVQPLAAIPARGNEVAEFIRLGIDKGLTIEALRELKAMWNEEEDRRAKREWVAAMVEFKKHRPAVIRTHINTFLKVTRVTAKGMKVSEDAKYPGLSDVEKALKSHSDFGLSYGWTNEKIVDRLMTLSCAVSHCGGHTEYTTISGPILENKGTSQASSPIQLYSGTRSYLARGSLMMAFGLASVDDDSDGNEPIGQPSDAPRITPDQVRQIEDLLSATDIEKEKFLNVYKVKLIADLNPEQYVQAIKRFDATIAARKLMVAKPSNQ